MGLCSNVPGPSPASSHPLWLSPGPLENPHPCQARAAAHTASRSPGPMGSRVQTQGYQNTLHFIFSFRILYKGHKNPIHTPLRKTRR